MTKKWVIYITLAGICFLTYLNSLNGAFVSDDLAAILQNRQISHFKGFLFDPQSLLNSLGYLLGGFNPAIYHFLSVLLHSLNTILVFLFLSIFFNAAASFLGAALFAVHPIHTEAVSWISGRPYILNLLFALTVYLLYYRAIYLKPKNKILLYAVSLGIFCYFLIGYYSFFALTPFMLVLTDLSSGKRLKNWRWWLPFFLIVVVRIILAQGLIAHRVSLIREQVAIPTMQNPIIYFVYSFYSYLGLLLWPDKLTLYHEPIIIPQSFINYSVLLFLPIALALVLTYKKTKTLFFSLAIFIIFLAPTYSPVPITSIVTERYAYISSLSLSMALAFLFQSGVLRFAKFKKILLTLLIMIIFAYGARTVARNHDWSASKIFWEKTVETSPDSVRARTNLGLIYAEEGDKDAALREYNKAIIIEPNFSDAYNNRGNIYAQEGKFTQAISDYNNTIDINPGDAEAYSNRGNAYAGMGDFAKALSDFKKSLELAPGYAKTYNNRAVVYFMMKEYGKSWKDLHKAESLGCQIFPPFLEALKKASGNEK